MILEGMYAYGWTNAAVSNAPSRLRDALRRYCPTLLDPGLHLNLNCNKLDLVKPNSKQASPLTFCASLGANPTSKRQSRSMTASRHTSNSNDYHQGCTASTPCIPSAINPGTTGAVSAIMNDTQDISLSGATIPEPHLNFEGLNWCQDLPVDAAVDSNGPWTGSSSLIDFSIDTSSGMLGLDLTHWNTLEASKLNT